jgi:hypothetical protein
MARYTGPKSRIARKFGEGIFGAKLNYSIKARAHGLFLKKEYYRILNLKMGVSSWF